MTDQDTDNNRSSSSADIKKEKAQRKLDVDAILNRAAIRLAETQRLVDAMLGSSPAVEAARIREREETASASRSQTKPVNGASSEAPKEDDPFDGLIGREETSGLGSVLPGAVAGKSSSFLARASPAGADKGGLEDLRRKLLGKKGMSNGHSVNRPHGNEPGGKRQRLDSDSEDEDEGRAGAFASRKTPTTRLVSTSASANKLDTEASGSIDDAKEHAAAMETPTTQDEQPASLKVQTQAKKPLSFLDEVLSQRENKKRKKRRKKNKQHADTGPSINT